jgi:hypothetical protein
MKLSGKTICISLVLLAIGPVITAFIAEGLIPEKWGWGKFSMPGYLLRSYLIGSLIYCVWLAYNYFEEKYFEFLRNNRY